MAENTPPIYHQPTPSHCGTKQLGPEFKKFGVAENRSGSWIVALCTKSPEQREWKDAVELISKKYAPWFVESLKGPLEPPGEYFLGVLRASLRVRTEEIGQTV
jgi:hypothetical protein